MTFFCRACSHDQFKDWPYLCPPGPRTATRLAFDIVQRIGWAVLPLERIPAGYARRFAQGLFKFRAVRRCLKCGLGVIAPMPDQRELDRYYRSFYVDVPLSGLPAIELRGRSQAWHIARAIDLSGISDTFEFGAGSASLSRALVEAAPQICATVVELSRSVLTALQNEPAIYRALDVYGGPDSAFDLIVASHALEHVVDAETTLRDWSRWLRPSGYLFVEVPNADIDHYKVNHEYIPHTWFFTAPSIDRMAQNVGLETVSIQIGGLTYADAIAGRLPPEKEAWRETKILGSQLRGVWRKPA